MSPFFHVSFMTSKNMCQRGRVGWRARRGGGVSTTKGSATKPGEAMSLTRPQWREGRGGGGEVYGGREGGGGVGDAEESEGS